MGRIVVVVVVAFSVKFLQISPLTFNDNFLLLNTYFSCTNFLEPRRLKGIGGRPGIQLKEKTEQEVYDTYQSVHPITFGCVHPSTGPWSIFF